MTSPILYSLNHVNFSYPNRQSALNDVTLSVAPQERIALLGANGSGKSTLLKLLGGLLTTQEGQIEFCGHPLTEATLHHPEFNRLFRTKVGIVFQNSEAQLFCPTVWEEISFGPIHLGIPPEETRQRVNDLLQMLRIERLRDRIPEQLSGGEKKRVAIAAVLATHPDILLLDEPTTALDPRSRWELVDIILNLQAANKTVITATNDLEIVPAIAQRLCILDETNHLLADGSAEELLARKDILEQANLIHVHTHTHPDAIHRHAHLHQNLVADHHKQPEKQ